MLLNGIGIIMSKLSCTDGINPPQMMPDIQDPERWLSAMRQDGLQLFFSQNDHPGHVDLFVIPAYSTPENFPLAVTITDAAALEELAETAAYLARMLRMENRPDSDTGVEPDKAQDDSITSQEWETIRSITPIRYRKMLDRLKKHDNRPLTGAQLTEGENSYVHYGNFNNHFRRCNIPFRLMPVNKEGSKTLWKYRIVRV